MCEGIVVGEELQQHILLFGICSPSPDRIASMCKLDFTALFHNRLKGDYANPNPYSVIPYGLIKEFNSATEQHTIKAVKHL